MGFEEVYHIVNDITYITSSLTRTGLGGVAFTASLYGASGVLLTSSDKYPDMFLYFNNALAEAPRQVESLSFEMSRSFVGTEPTIVQISFGTGGPTGGNLSSPGALFVNPDSIQSNVPVTLVINNNWEKYTMDLRDSSIDSWFEKTFALNCLADTGVKLVFYVNFYDAVAPDTAVPCIFAFRDFKLNFQETLTDTGVKKFRDMENEFINDSISCLKYDTLKKIE